ncbi:vesicle associated membrane protein 1 [Turdus rufiventris]|nr:vesicle associated membrane protein 1 [Turdus rufiventris]
MRRRERRAPRDHRRGGAGAWHRALLPLDRRKVVDIMCVNVDKVLQRDEKLSELDDRADALQAGASVFESSAAKLKRKYWWKNCKMMIIMGVIGALVVVVIAHVVEEKPQLYCSKMDIP